MATSFEGSESEALQHFLSQFRPSDDPRAAHWTTGDYSHDFRHVPIYVTTLGSSPNAFEAFCARLANPDYITSISDYVEKLMEHFPAGSYHNPRGVYCTINDYRRRSAGSATAESRARVAKAIESGSDSGISLLVGTASIVSSEEQERSNRSFHLANRGLIPMKAFSNHHDAIVWCVEILENSGVSIPRVLIDALLENYSSTHSPKVREKTSPTTPAPVSEPESPMASPWRTSVRAFGLTDLARSLKVTPRELDILGNIHIPHALPPHSPSAWVFLVHLIREVVPPSGDS